MSYLKSKKNTLGAGSREILETVPHIIPDVLYPAIFNIMADGSTALSAVTTGPNGSTVTSSKYGTVQSDGRMYYYTDIRGSKPIKDPRIGAHFGSQRHTCQHLTIQEQETAAHGLDVYRVDGREWLRGVGDNVSMQSDLNGRRVGLYDTDNFWEITFYGSHLLVKMELHSANRGWTTAVDGGTASAERTPTQGGISGPGPLGGRYLDGSSLANTEVNVALGIHTVKLTPYGSSDECGLYAIELIAQDTTSLTTKHQMQIPSQNVVSFGKNWTVKPEAKHYNPFAFKTDGSTVWASGAHNGTSWPIGTGSSHYIDTATSLGLENWLHSSNYYKPYNGGRVVKWIASDGTIKTSVNVMPPNAKSAGGLAISAKANASIANNTYLPTFEAGMPEHSEDDLSEIAKKFHWREFGNGASNGGTGSSKADASMLNTTDNISYVMDDGLTSISGLAYYAHATYGLIRNAAGNDLYFTFIGTGLTIDGQMGELPGWECTVAENLPYGTHIFQIQVDGSSSSSGKWYVDGVAVKIDFNNVGGSGELSIYEHGPLNWLTFHQPKMPPIPKDAVVIADYMLMADFVQQTVGDSTDLSHISKGVRYCSSSRDVYYKDGSFSFSMSNWVQVEGPSGDAEQSITAFTDNVTIEAYDFPNRHRHWDINGTDNVTTTKNGGGHGSIMYTASTGDLPELGINRFGTDGTGSSTMDFKWYQIASPTHTSSHYQPFETPFAFELIGGDRNMEQTNLVVTGDGKTWDEVRRDTSYMGDASLSTNVEQAISDNTTHPIFNEWRGDASSSQNQEHYNKHFAIAYDRMICLYDGQYQFCVHSVSDNNNEGRLMINDVIMTKWHDPSTGSAAHLGYTTWLNRGDYVQWAGTWNGTREYQAFLINRI